MPKAKRAKPNPGTEHLFDPHTGKMYPPMCRSNVYVALPSCPDPHLIECEVPEDDHPNQPHMARIEASEAFTDGFVGWWDATPPNPLLVPTDPTEGGTDHA